MFRWKSLIVATLGMLACTINSAAADEKYIWRNVAIGGGGFVTGVEFHPTEHGLAYARTDVGGAYRWDESVGAWTPLLDWLGQDEWNWQGVESLAIDPTDANRVYLAVGTYTLPVPEVSNGAILRSADRGNTWAVAPLPFKLGANEAGRGSGERLVVDPNFPSLIYFGARRDGLWQSNDRGETWHRNAAWPDVPDDSIKHKQEPGGRYNPLAQAVGVLWVRVDRSSGKLGSPTPVVYAAISRTGDSLYQSTDSGKTWALAPNQPQSLRPTNAALAPDGTLYVTYADEPGPSRMRNGAVWKYEPQSGQWTELTPEKPTETRTFGYAGVCIDPADPKTILVTTWNRHEPCDEIFRSTDGGKTWVPLMANATWDHSSAPYTETMKHHWMSDPEIDPSNRDRIIFNTGYGLWASTNATRVSAKEPIHWVFFYKGLEETVPLTLISPSAGAHLISGVGDIDGFVHDDFSVSPAAGRFPAPGYKNTEWLDYAALVPTTIVRTGTTYKDDRILGAISEDGGRTWKAFATEPQHPNDSHRFTTGPIAISADAKIVTWTPFHGAPNFSADRGQTWVEAPLPPNIRAVPDRVEPDTFYAYDPAVGALHVSTDGGKSFAKIHSGLALPPAKKGSFRVNYGDLQTMPSRAGEFWLATGTQLYRFTKQGRQRTSFPDFNDATAVGFGKPTPARNEPAVYVIGKYKGVQGIYRSDDSGASWLKITDDQHRFGSASRITGDPRVFGRVYFCTGGRGIVYGDRVVNN
ncbi:MAG: hypothetical protein QM790_15495 [Nibricoccus sp.]